MSSPQHAAAERWPINSFLSKVKSVGFDLTPPILSSATGPTVQIQGQEFINFAGSSLLGMHVNSDAVAHFQDAARKYGLATGGSRLTQGKLEAITELEEQLCGIHGHQSALTFASGLLANLGFAHAFSRAVTLTPSLALDMSDTMFVLDRDSHWSVHKSVEALKGSERVQYYRHNDMEHLESILKNVRNKPTFIMFESVYSVDGSIAPMRDIVALAQQYGAMTYVDDANGYLIYDAPNRPFYEEFVAMRDVDFHMVSFSKSVGLEGGAISSTAEHIEALEWLSGTSSFTATILPPAASTATYITTILRENPSIVDDYLRMCGDLRSRLIDSGFTISPTGSYITNILIGRDDIAEAVRRAFLNKRILIPVFRYPASPRGKAGIRLMPSALHHEEHIDSFHQALIEIRDTFHF